MAQDHENNAITTSVTAGGQLEPAGSQLAGAHGPAASLAALQRFPHQLPHCRDLPFLPFFFSLVLRQWNSSCPGLAHGSYPPPSQY
jgi:hypothetical protein